uniref:Saposin B-type domain-containing protein n=1 Tax=Malurus cyaneus samueli TaxID=2593467 RepID=A0A8C5UAA7_9PASS
MAAAFLLVLVVIGGNGNLPASQGRWSPRGGGDTWDNGDEDGVAQGRKVKCSLCTKILEKIQALAGDDPDEEALAAALRKGCRKLGRLMAKPCQQLVKKYKDQITEGLQNGDAPRNICIALRICRS